MPSTVGLFRDLGAGPSRDRQDAVWFALRFSLFAALGLGLLYLAPMEPLLRVLATIVAWALRVSGLPVVLQGHEVVLPGDFGIDITTECSGAAQLLLFLGAVFAYPTSQRSRLMGAVLAVVAVLAGNLLRLLTLFWIGVYAPEHFEFAHSYIWGGLSYTALCVLWVFWLRRLATPRKADEPLGGLSPVTHKGAMEVQLG